MEGMNIICIATLAGRKDIPKKNTKQIDYEHTNLLVSVYTLYSFCLCMYNFQLTTPVGSTVLLATESSSLNAFITLSGRGEGRGTG